MAISHEFKPELDMPYMPEEAYAAQRDYAKALLYGAGQQPVKHWTQGASNMLAALLGGYGLNQANQGLTASRRALGTAREEGIRSPGLGVNPTSPGERAAPQTEATAPVSDEARADVAATPSLVDDAHLARLDAKYSGLPLRDAIGKWASDKPRLASLDLDGYTNKIASDAGLTPMDTVTPEMLRSPQGQQMIQAMMAQEQDGVSLAPAAPDQRVQVAQALGKKGVPGSTYYPAPGGQQHIDPRFIPQQPRISAGAMRRILTERNPAAIDTIIANRYAQQGQPQTIPYGPGTITIDPRTGAQRFDSPIQKFEWEDVDVNGDRVKRSIWGKWVPNGQGGFEVQEMFVPGSQAGQSPAQTTQVGATLDDETVVRPPPPGLSREARGKWIIEEDKRARAAKVDRENAAQDAATIVTSLDEAVKLVEANPWTSVGTIGQWAKFVGGTAAKDLETLLAPVKANIGMQRLTRMRKASPTGAALGPVSDYENRFLQALLGSLEQEQSYPQLMANMKRIRAMYNDILHGVPDENNPGKFRRLTEEELKTRYPLEVQRGGGEGKKRLLPRGGPPRRYNPTTDKVE